MAWEVRAVLPRPDTVRFFVGLLGSSRGLATSLPRHDTKRLTTAEHIRHLLSKPTWSVASLLPSTSNPSKPQEITAEELHHLLRLSALPPPKDQREEDRMLETLASQLHFVKEVQDVDTTGVEPLYSLRDETKAGRQEATLGLSELQEALAQEEVVGTYHKRIRRKHIPANQQPSKDWDVLRTAETKVGRYFVVEGGKD